MWTDKRRFCALVVLHASCIIHFGLSSLIGHRPSERCTFFPLLLLFPYSSTSRTDYRCISKYLVNATNSHTPPTNANVCMCKNGIRAISSSARPICVQTRIINFWSLKNLSFSSIYDMFIVNLRSTENVRLLFSPRRLRKYRAWIPGLNGYRAHKHMYSLLLFVLSLWAYVYV